MDKVYVIKNSEGQYMNAYGGFSSERNACLFWDELYAKEFIRDGYKLYSVDVRSAFTNEQEVK